MVKLFNLSDIHIKQASEIDALTLLHFCADAVKDWECSEKTCDEHCPFYWAVSKNICILEGIKDVAYLNLEKPLDDFGNPIEEENES